MGFVAFAEARVDVAVVTPVSLDHAEYLGPDETSIAAEKAGISKRCAVAVLAGQIPPAERALLRRAGEVGAGVLRENHDYGSWTAGCLAPGSSCVFGDRPATTTLSCRFSGRIRHGTRPPRSPRRRRS